MIRPLAAALLLLTTTPLNALVITPGVYEVIGDIPGPTSALFYFTGGTEYQGPTSATAIINGHSFSVYDSHDCPAMLGVQCNHAAPPYLSIIYSDTERTISVDSFTMSGSVFQLNVSLMYGGLVPFEGIAAVPEPSTWAMLILGFAAIGFTAVRRQWMTMKS